MPTIYNLKSRFQATLRPTVARLERQGVTATKSPSVPQFCRWLGAA